VRLPGGALRERDCVGVREGQALKNTTHGVSRGGAQPLIAGSTSGERLALERVVRRRGQGDG
jgi:hypothetical protein